MGGFTGARAITCLYPPFRALQLSHPRRYAAERDFALGSFRRISWRAEGPIGSCHATVAKALAREGGLPVAGWQIHIWPGVFIEALFHYVWQSPDGKLVDLSHKYPGDPTQHTVFIPAAPGQARHSRYHILNRRPEVQALISAARQQARHRCEIEARVRQRLGGQGVVCLLDHADTAERAVLADDEAWVATAIAACLRIPGQPVGGYASPQRMPSTQALLARRR